jgi:multiple sugar transport system substrate-binding protein
MNPFNRRKFLEGSAGVAAAATLGPAATIWAPAVHAQTALTFKPEKGAKLRLLRWSRFVQGDIDAYMANVKKFTEKTGIEVRVDNEGWEDVRRRPRWPPTPAPARTSSCRPTTMPTCTPRSCST